MAAKHLGAVRADLRAEELSALAVGGTALRSVHRNRARATVLVRLLLDGR